MKNTKMRKKMLISSIAMLMVATVSLGSATYAWFTQSPTASASGLVMRATASNGLKILTQSHKAVDDAAPYSSADYLNYDANGQGTGKPGSSTTAFLLNPASYHIVNDSAPVGPFKTTAAGDNASTASANAAVEDAIVGLAAGSDVYKEEIYCKLVGAADDNATTRLNLTSLSVTMGTNTDFALKNAVRVMLTYTEKDGTEKIIGAYAPTTVTGATIKQKASKYSELTAEGADGKGTYTFNAFTSATKVATKNSETKVWEGGIGSLGTSGEDKVTVYVYLDGEAGECFSQNIKASDILTKVQVNLSIPTN